MAPFVSSVTTGVMGIGIAYCLINLARTVWTDRRKALVYFAVASILTAGLDYIWRSY